MWPELVLSTGYVCLVELGILSIRERGFGGLIHRGRTCRDMRELEGEARKGHTEKEQGWEERLNSRKSSVVGSRAPQQTDPL